MTDIYKKFSNYKQSEQYVPESGNWIIRESTVVGALTVTFNKDGKIEHHRYAFLDCTPQTQTNHTSFFDNTRKDNEMVNSIQYGWVDVTKLNRKDVASLLNKKGLFFMRDLAMHESYLALKKRLTQKFDLKAQQQIKPQQIDEQSTVSRYSGYL